MKNSSKISDSFESFEVAKKRIETAACGCVQRMINGISNGSITDYDVLINESHLIRSEDCRMLFLEALGCFLIEFWARGNICAVVVDLRKCDPTISNEVCLNSISAVFSSERKHTSEEESRKLASNIFRKNREVFINAYDLASL